LWPANPDPELGPELFVEGTWALVCYECGQKHAPELMRCLFEYRNTLRLEGFSNDFPGTAVIVDQGEDAPNVRHLRPVEEPPGDEGYLPLS
jgi:hypothetical protein